MELLEQLMKVEDRPRSEYVQIRHKILDAFDLLGEAVLVYVELIEEGQGGGRNDAFLLD